VREARGAALSLAAVATGAAAVVVPLIYLPALEAPFVVPKTAVLEVAAALGLLGYAMQLGAERRVRWSAPAALGAALLLATTLLAWAAAPAAPYAVPALARWGALFGVACGAAVVGGDPQARQRLLEAVAGAAAVVSALGVLQHLELLPLPIPVISAPGATFGNRNLAAEAVAVALPLGCAAAAAARPAVRRALAAALVLALLYLAATRARGAWLGAALGLATAALLARPRFTRRQVVLGALAALAAIAAGLLPGRSNPMYAGDAKRFASGADVVQASFDTRSTALRTRLGIWRRGLALVHDHPLVGVGPGNWPVAFPRYAEPGALHDGVLTMWLGPRQAHDDFLERAAETGLVGLAALGFLIAGVAVTLRRRLAATDDHADRVALAGAAGALVALLGGGLTGFPLEMPGTIALGGVALGLAVAVPGGAPRGRVWRAAAVAGAALLLLGAAARGGRQVYGNLWLGGAERALHRDRGRDGAERALATLERAAALTPDSFRVPLRTAQMLLRLQRFGEAVAAARRALALEPLAPNAWATLAAAQLGAGQVAEARGSAAQALALLHEHPFALFTAARAAEAAGDGDAAATSWKQLEAISRDAAADRETASAAREFLGPHGGEPR
jgi:putative inorganic carbon (HCO3(-)) transporter